MSSNHERNAEILRRLETRRPFEVARDMGLSYAVVGGVLRRWGKHPPESDEDKFWAMVDAWPDPPWSFDQGRAVIRDIMIRL